MLIKIGFIGKIRTTLNKVEERGSQNPVLIFPLSSISTRANEVRGTKRKRGGGGGGGHKNIPNFCT